MSSVTPFIRYALLILSGLAARGGWLPEEIGEEFANDPLVLEVIVSAFMGLGTLFWYLYSRSRKAFLEALS